MMNMMKLMIALVILSISVACGEIPRAEMSFCDKEMEYSLWPNGEGYRLYLSVGTVDEHHCRNPYRGRREVSMVRNISSKEEALMLINEYQKKISGKVVPSTTSRAGQKVVPSVSKPATLINCHCLKRDGK